MVTRQGNVPAQEKNLPKVRTDLTEKKEMIGTEKDLDKDLTQGKTLKDQEKETEID